MLTRKALYQQVDHQMELETAVAEHETRIAGTAGADERGLMKRTVTMMLSGAGLMVAASAFTLLAAPRKVDAARGCTRADARGTYGFQFTGFAPKVFPGVSAELPFAETGTFVVGARGSLDGSSNLSYGGLILRQTFSGEVTVDPDCTARVSGVNHTFGKSFDLSWVMVKPGEEILLFSHEPGSAANGRAERIMRPRGE
jgi:hypothetical protein